MFRVWRRDYREYVISIIVKNKNGDLTFPFFVASKNLPSTSHYLDFQLYQVASEIQVLWQTILSSPSGFNRLKHSDNLLLSKTSFTHSVLLRWQIDYAG
ncbi:hypothetical protein DQ811_19200 [Salmonella enterica subsp. diarizonae]|nr:hypothetical protein [Salmonella enterica subsp. diarizonae]